MLEKDNQSLIILSSDSEEDGPDSKALNAKEAFIEQRLLTLDESSCNQYGSMFEEFETWSRSLLRDMMEESDVSSDTIEKILDMCNIENEVTKNQFFVAMDLVTRSIRGEGLASLPLASLRSSTPCLVTGTPAPSSLPLSPINNFQQAQNVPQEYLCYVKLVRLTDQDIVKAQMMKKKRLQKKKREKDATFQLKEKTKDALKLPDECFRRISQRKKTTVVEKRSLNVLLGNSSQDSNDVIDTYTFFKDKEERNSISSCTSCEESEKSSALESANESDGQESVPFDICRKASRAKIPTALKKLSKEKESQKNMDARLAKVEDALNGDQNDVPEGEVFNNMQMYLDQFTSKEICELESEEVGCNFFDLEGFEKIFSDVPLTLLSAFGFSPEPHKFFHQKVLSMSIETFRRAVLDANTLDLIFIMEKTPQPLATWIFYFCSTYRDEITSEYCIKELIVLIKKKVWMPGMKKLFTVLANFGVKRDRYPIHEADAQELHAKSTQAYDAIRDKKKFISVKILNIIKIVRAVLEASEFELELYLSYIELLVMLGADTMFTDCVVVQIAVESCMEQLLKRIPDTEYIDFIKKSSELVLRLASNLPTRVYIFERLCPLSSYEELAMALAFRILQHYLSTTSSAAVIVPNAKDVHNLVTNPKFPLLRCSRAKKRQFEGNELRQLHFLLRTIKASIGNVSRVLPQHKSFVLDLSKIYKNLSSDFGNSLNAFIVEMICEARTTSFLWDALNDTPALLNIF